jgi:hypothetical protein
VHGYCCEEYAPDIAIQVPFALDHNVRQSLPQQVFQEWQQNTFFVPIFYFFEEPKYRHKI